MKVIDMKPITKQIVSAKEYVALSESMRNNIKETRILPPVLGGKNFGAIEVTYDLPVYCAR
ncbi:MAG: hypothetical protein PHN84_14475 [Desulfuromonadaceae bacterium]|nr:hypothetical protein [Desulfuromonadaceae bacterium]MDD2856789.1 hypothetical protein [Desulfuromonadaceae bacterium]